MSDLDELSAKRNSLKPKKARTTMGATVNQINEFLESPDWTESEKWVIRWQFGLLDDDFAKPLAECIKLADQYNLMRLELGFPVEVGGFKQWAYSDLGERLRSAGLRI
jgi:hypothetical protein